MQPFERFSPHVESFRVVRSFSKNLLRVLCSGEMKKVASLSRKREVVDSLFGEIVSLAQRVACSSIETPLSLP